MCYNSAEHTSFSVKERTCKDGEDMWRNQHSGHQYHEISLEGIVNAGKL